MTAKNSGQENQTVPLITFIFSTALQLLWRGFDERSFYDNKISALAGV